MKKLSKYISPLLLIGAAVIWGFAFTAQKAAVEVPPFMLGALRSAIASIFLLILIPVSDRIRGEGRSFFSRKRGASFTRTELIGGAVCGVILAAAISLQQFGIELGTNAGKASFITALYVVIVPIYALIFGRRSSLSVWIAVSLAAVGFYFLCITDGFALETSDLFVLLCAFFFAMHIMAGDRYSPVCDCIRLSCLQFFVASLINLVLALVFERGVAPEVLLSNIPYMLYLGIGSSGVAYTLQLLGQKGTHPAAASIILSTESVFGVLGSAWLLGERMNSREVVGCAILLFAVILAQVGIPQLFQKTRVKQKDEKEQ